MRKRTEGHRPGKSPYQERISLLITLLTLIFGVWGSMGATSTYAKEKPSKKPLDVPQYIVLKQESRCEDFDFTCLTSLSRPYLESQEEQEKVTPTPTPKSLWAHAQFIPQAYAQAPSTPTPTVAVVASTPTPAATATGGLNADLLFSMVNTKRTEAGLPAFEKEPRVCEVVNSRAPELYNEIFVTYTMHQGFYARNLPYWATENMIHMNTEQQALSWWLSSPVHRGAIYGNYKYSCTACSGNSCAQVFTNFEAK